MNAMGAQIFCLLAFYGMTCTACGESLLPKDLMADMDHTLSVMEAGADLDSANYALERDRAKKGWRAFSSFGYANIHDVIDVGQTRDYDALQGRVGLSYPLLGSYEKDVRDIDASAGKVQEKSVRAEAARALAGLMLESAYADYWAAQDSLTIVNAYLASEPVVMPGLRMRRQQHLMLESDSLAKQQEYDEVRSDRLRFERARRQARERLNRMTGRSLGEFEASELDLPAIPAMPMDTLLLKYPDLAAIAANRKSMEMQLDHSDWYGVDSNVEVSQSGVQDLSASQTGGTLYAGVTLNAPLGVLGARRAERQRIQAEINGLNLRYKERSEELSAQVQNAEETFSQLQSELDSHIHRTQATTQALREAMLRGQALRSPGLESLTGRLHDHYRSALSEIDTRLKRWQAHIDLRGYAYLASDDHLQPTPSTVDRASELADPIQQANRLLGGGIKVSETDAQPDSRDTVQDVTPMLGNIGRQPGEKLAQASETGPKLYVKGGLSTWAWNSQELLSAAQSSDAESLLWSRLRQLSINRLYFSMSSDQIQAAASNPASMTAFLDAARNHGVAVELLLGEPTWIVPSNRIRLVEIIRSLRAFKFSGLHLDIEPDQIYSQPLTQSQFNNWMAVYQAASAESPWPIAADIHPRYFRDAAYSSWHVATRLRAAGVKEADLLVFNANPQAVANIAMPIMTSASQLLFRIGQSVEPELDSTLSHSNQSPAALQATLQQLQKLLAVPSNFLGIGVQSWADLQALENKG
jgi:outer membrane protein TolC